MYAKIVSTQWTLTGPPKSRVQGTDREYAYEFEHELGCPTQGSTQDCTCYVSRIRLVKTPVGRMIPTTEPDLNPELEFWEARAKHWERHAERLRTAVIWSLASCVLLGACVIILSFGAR